MSTSTTISTFLSDLQAFGWNGSYQIDGIAASVREEVGDLAIISNPNLYPHIRRVIANQLLSSGYTLTKASDAVYAIIARAYRISAHEAHLKKDYTNQPNRHKKPSYFEGSPPAGARQPHFNSTDVDAYIRLIFNTVGNIFLAVTRADPTRFTNKYYSTYSNQLIDRLKTLISDSVRKVISFPSSDYEGMVLAVENYIEVFYAMLNNQLPGGPTGKAAGGFLAGIIQLYGAGAVSSSVLETAFRASSKFYNTLPPVQILDQHLDGLDLAHQHLCLLAERIVLSNTALTLRKLQLEDASIETSTLKAVSYALYSSSVTNSTFIKGALQSPKNVTFKNVLFKDLNLTGDLVDVTFEGCTFKNCSLMGLNTLKNPGVLVGQKFEDCFPPEATNLDAASAVYLRLAGLEIDRVRARW